jgi:hypothetical protein
MRFPTVFKRQKGSASTDPALGSDAAPTTTPPSQNNTNVVFCRQRDVNGWPAQRIAFCWNTSASSPTAMNVSAYFWEDATQHWYLINATPLSAAAGQLYFFDCVTILEAPPLSASLSNPATPAQAGGMAIAIVVSDPGSQVTGVFQFAAGPDMSTVGT